MSRRSLPGVQAERQSQIHDDYNFSDPRDEPNPFVLPDGDIFMMRERERKAKAADRLRRSKQKIWQKTAGHQQFRSAGRLARAFRRRNKARAKQKPDRMFQGRPNKKENMADFIQKKRQMFLTQMSLDTKWEEIKKLEEKAEMKENALRKSEIMLEEDALRFGEFLKQNDQKAHDALRRADEKATEKQEKVEQIKVLNQKISKYENEVSKQQDVLNRCLKYKRFLDKLSPEEYKDAKAKRKAARKAEKDRIAAEQGLPIVSDDESSSDGEMYFKHPDQLLAIFRQLERRSLFLIENSQETEEALEQLNQKFAATRQEMGAKTAELEKSIAVLKQQIQEQEDKAAVFSVHNRANAVEGNQLDLLEALRAKVREVATSVGFDTQADPLGMLRDVEGWLEYLLDQMSYMDPGLVKEFESSVTSKRRDAQRKKNKQQENQQAAQNSKASRRSHDVVRRIGRQVMFRSPPLHKKTIVVETEERDEEREELLGFFS